MNMAGIFSKRLTTNGVAQDLERFLVQPFSPKVPSMRVLFPESKSSEYLHRDREVFYAFVQARDLVM